MKKNDTEGRDSRGLDARINTLLLGATTMPLAEIAKTLALHVPSIAAALGLFLFALPDLLGSYEWGLTKILSVKIAGLLSIAISSLTLIFRHHLRQQRAAIKRLIRSEFDKLNVAK